MSENILIVMNAGIIKKNTIKFMKKRVVSSVRRK